MKIIITPMLLKLNLVLIFILFASVFDSSGQTTSNLAPRSTEDVEVMVRSSVQINDAVLNEYSTGKHQFTPASRAMVTPFQCESGLVYIITNTPSSNGNISGLYSYNLGTKIQTLIKDPLVESNTSSQFINAIGYNVVDNYIYGFLQGTNKVVKIDATGAIEYLTVTGNFTSGDYSSGDVDKNGILYIYGQGKFVAINLNPSASDYLVGKTLLNYSTTVHDITFSPIDDNLYMMTSNGSRALLRFNTSTNTITNLGSINGLSAESTNSFGTAFMDSVGNMFISNNASGNIYKIASPHTGGLIATAFNSLNGTPGDGARCPNETVPPNAVKDQACVIGNETITIDLLQNDGAGSFPIDVASVQLIDASTNATSTSVTVAGQGTFSVNNTGILTFTPETGFTTTSIEYFISDTSGIVSDRATITVSANTTVAPTGSSIQEFCTAENLTIANLNVTGNAVKWYGALTSTTSLPVSTILEEKTYYATQTTASGCESLERLAVTVKLNSETTLVNSETLTCTIKKTAYIIKATFKGATSYSANGNGAPGKFINNSDQTTTWISDPIKASVLSYNVEIEGLNSCNNVVLAGDAPFECLAQTFDCADGLAFILTNTGTDQSNYVTGLYTLNLATNAQNLVKYPLVADTTSSQFINAIGYNKIDNLLYGLLQSTNKIARIDHTGDVEFFDITGPFTTGYYSSGDMDESGNLYLYNGKKFVKVNLDPSSPNYLSATDMLNFTASVNDLVYNNIDDNIYMVTSSSNPKLWRYDLTTNAMVDLGLITGLQAETTNSFGTAFMDSTGNLFIANNGSGNTYKIASPHTGGNIATFYNSAMAGLQPGDGARCQDQITLPVANDDSVCGTADTDTIINVLANDGEGSFAFDISSVRFLDPITSEPTNSVVVAGQGTFTVDENGVVTFSPLATFTQASVQYTVKDVNANMSQPATISVYLNNTEAPTGEAIQKFCMSSEPTIADLVATGENIRWYDSATSTVALTPTTPLVDEAIYFATQTSGEGCESLDRLQVTVILNEDITLVTPEIASCDEDGSTYTVEATFTGIAPFTATGTATPGTWTDNMNGTSTWLSDAIASNVNYSIEVQDANGCNTITMSANAPVCCTLEVVCPTFADVDVDCYNDLPTQTSFTIQEFEALGNGDGRIGDILCGIVQITASNSDDNGSCSQIVTRTYTITEYEDTNNNGSLDADETTILNTIECVQIINVQDVTAPVIAALPAESTVECSVTPEFAQATATDACGSEVTLTFADVTTAGECSSDYIITRTWTATDSCGNASTASQTINVRDTTAPVIAALPAESTVECNVTPEFAQATATDACGSEVTLTFVDVTTAGECDNDYTMIRTWTAIDACGNASTASQTINVRDTTAPNLVTEYETNITITCDNIPLVPGLVFEDACSNDIDVKFNETSTANGGVKNYIITRTWTVSDTCNNEAVYTQTINVNIADAIIGSDTELCNDDNFDFDLFNLLSGTFETDGTWTVVTGNATLDGNIFNPYKLDLGMYTFKYSVADEYCPTETLVNIILNDDCVPLSCGAEDVVISKAVTAYADGKNDFFKITGVEDCGFTIEVQIFNRWGAMIYENPNYQNDWNGASSKASIGSSNYVPSGTYYYVVNLKNSGLKPFAGPIFVATK